MLRLLYPPPPPPEILARPCSRPRPRGSGPPAPGGSPGAPMETGPVAGLPDTETAVWGTSASLLPTRSRSIAFPRRERFSKNNSPGTTEGRWNLPFAAAGNCLQTSAAPRCAEATGGAEQSLPENVASTLRGRPATRTRREPRSRALSPTLTTPCLMGCPTWEGLAGTLARWGREGSPGSHSQDSPAPEQEPGRSVHVGVARCLESDLSSRVIETRPTRAARERERGRRAGRRGTWSRRERNGGLGEEQHQT